MIFARSHEAPYRLGDLACLLEALIEDVVQAEEDIEAVGADEGLLAGGQGAWHGSATSLHGLILITHKRVSWVIIYNTFSYARC
jgi:hypothetical protein